MASLVETWWRALVEPDRAGKLVLGIEKPRGFTRFVAVNVAVLYAIYGIGMGMFRGTYPALVSGFKLPFLYLFTLLICLPPLYVLNCTWGPRMTLAQSLRLLLLATSANAAALASYAPVSYFFALTTSRNEYGLLVLMNVVVFALAGIVSLAVIAVIFRATARERGIRLRPSFLLGWACLYAFVGSQMSWVLRPWIGTWNVEYAPLRPIEGSFIESVWQLVQSALST